MRVATSSRNTRLPSQVPEHIDPQELKQVDWITVLDVFLCNREPIGELGVIPCHCPHPSHRKVGRRVQNRRHGPPIVSSPLEGNFEGCHLALTSRVPFAGIRVDGAHLMQLMRPSTTGSRSVNMSKSHFCSLLGHGGGTTPRARSAAAKLSGTSTRQSERTSSTRETRSSSS
jgi:hypothetical protein